MTGPNKIRVLVIDDSALMRKLLPAVLARDPQIEVVGTAMDGSFGLQKLADLKPDVVTLDLDMPRMDGMNTLREMRRAHDTPVIIVSSHSRAGADATFRALAAGAFDFVAKPLSSSSAKLDEVADELIEKVKVAARSGGRRQRNLIASKATSKKPLKRTLRPASHIIGIGISTGGPNALQYLVSQLPPDFPACIVIVQHMPEGFTELFANRLDDASALEVKEARSGDLLLAGRVLICPGNRHIRVQRLPLGEAVVLGEDAKVNGHRPSVDVLFESLAENFGQRGMGVLMTGMGEDGAEGLGLVKRAGGMTVAQDEHSCVVFGMPRAAIQRGHAQRVVSLEALPNLLINYCAPVRQSAPELAVGAAISGD